MPRHNKSIIFPFLYLLFYLFTLFKAQFQQTHCGKYNCLNRFVSASFVIDIIDFFRKSLGFSKLSDRNAVRNQ